MPMIMHFGQKVGYIKRYLTISKVILFENLELFSNKVFGKYASKNKQSHNCVKNSKPLSPLKILWRNRMIAVLDF
jgi:hypothetical protein